MSCDEYKDYLEAYCDDVLPPQISQKVETHIKGCESCRKSVCEYQSLNALLNSYVEDRVPEERFAVMRDSILQRILNDERVVIPLDDTVPEPAAITLADRFDSLVSQFLSGFWRKAAITVTCVVIILVGLHFRPNPETALVEPLQTESTGNLAIDPMDIPDVPVEETTGEVYNDEPVAEVATQILQELNLMQIEMTSSSELEQYDLYETMFDELTTPESLSDDG